MPSWGRRCHPRMGTSETCRLCCDHFLLLSLPMCRLCRDHAFTLLTGSAGLDLPTVTKIARRAYTIECPTVPMCARKQAHIRLCGVTRTHTRQLSEKVHVHPPPSYCSYNSYGSYGSVSLYAPPPISPRVFLAGGHHQAR
jgi:hypothetical protein